jgi:peptidoglycan glycosyltransferase
MNKQIRRLAVFVAVCYIALFVKLNQIQLIDAPDLNARPDNTRKIERDFNRPRGTISTADGVVVARSKATRGRFAYQREYPTHDLFAHVVGSYSYQFGADGVEKVYNDELAGQTPDLQLRGYTDPFKDHSNVGNLVLTLRNDVQATARQELGDRKGSVVALDPRTGAVLALWSTPSYDPNFTSSNDSKVARAFREQLDRNPDKPRLAKAYRDRFAPGSTFKIVTGSAGVESGKVTNDAPSYPRVSSYTPPLTSRPIRNFDGATCGGTLDEILRVSCNASFAQMGAETLGPKAMISEAESFGFNATPPIDLTSPAESVFPTDYGRRVRAGAVPGSADVYENSAALAQASIGQYSVAATPLEMALVAAAIADRGTIMVPHVMDRVVDVDGAADEKYESKVWKEATGPSTADVLRQDMIGVAESGTARAIRIAGIEIGAKTGTAQLGTAVPRSHAWTIAFAGPPGQPPEIAVAVIVEGQPGASEQTGGRVAAPIARAVIETALRR